MALNNYVMNVIEDAQERQTALNDMKHLSNLIYLSVRADKKSVGKNWKEYNDGWLTTANTFQKFYTLEEVQREFNNDINWKLTVLTNNSNEIMFSLVRIAELEEAS